MGSASVSHAEKNSSRSTFTDWEDRNNEIRKTSNILCENSFGMRRDSALLRLETKIKTYWDAYHNEEKLDQRIWAVRGWQEQIQHALSDTTKEMENLMSTKGDLEDALQALTVPFAVVATCVTLRDGRRGAELTRDEPNVLLQQELQNLESQKARLHSLGAEAWQTHKRLAEIQAILQVAITEQISALNTDEETLALTKLSPGLSLRPEPARTAPESSVPASWESHCQELVERRRATCESSKVLREEMLKAISGAQNAIRDQGEETDRAIRLRSFTLQRSIDDLEWQRQQLTEELGRAQGEVTRLREAGWSLEAPRRLCETRHERRCTERPAGVERCQDSAQDGLAEESAAIEVSQARMQLALESARRTHEKVRAQLGRIERDLEDKKFALALERRVQAERLPQGTPPDKPGDLAGDRVRAEHFTRVTSHQL